MTTNDQSSRADQIGKIFFTLSQDMRQCLICDGVFTKQGAAAHNGVACHPPKGTEKINMQIGEPLRTIVVEPLELPVSNPQTQPDPERAPQPEPEPEQVPVKR